MSLPLAPMNRISLAMVLSIGVHLLLILGIAVEVHKSKSLTKLQPLRIEFLGVLANGQQQPKKVEALAEIDQQAGGGHTYARESPATTPLPISHTLEPETLQPTPVIPPVEVRENQVTPAPAPLVRPKPRTELTVSNKAVDKPRSKENTPKTEKPVIDPMALKMSPSLGDVAAWDNKYQEEARRRESRGEGAVDINTRQVKYADYFRGVKHRIEQVWVYPNSAKKNRQTGNLLLEFTIDREGNMVEIELLRSSGVSLLDDAAIKAISKAGPFPPLPNEWNKQQLRVKVTFEYLMRNLGW
ncbi:MAG: energy transducer TonB [Magnetococcales bacterium]|nr:energy transducer TonB [Magnetococcales bacterium]NGZ26624.1 energy transducer TonB [Magnetococcales bacterium]